MSVVGDNGYLVKAYLLTTYGILVNDCQNNCNEAFKRTCSVQTFGILKMFFRCLHSSGDTSYLISLEMDLVLLSAPYDLRGWEVGRNCHSIKRIKQKLTYKTREVPESITNNIIF